jgi:hypothetical protein
MKIEPQAVDESVIDRFFDYRSRTTSRPSDNATRRILARLWNGCIGTIDKWPARHLFEPPVKSAQILPWTNFPEALRVGIDQYINNLAALGRSDREGRRKRPCKASTLTMRRRELVAAVRMADKIGVPISNLLSLAELVRPEVAEKILDAYCQQDGEVPKAYTINLAGRFVKPALIASVVNGKISAAVRGIESMI